MKPPPPPPGPDTPRAAARRLRRSIRRALLVRAAWGSLSFGLLLAGGAFLALRIAAPGLSPLRLLPWTSVPVALLFAALALPALRRLPAEERCLAAVESATRAGGLALCDGMPGADAWASPGAVVPAVRFRPSPALSAALPLAALFCALSLALPARLFERILPPPPDPTGVLALAAREEERLEDLLGTGALDEAKAAELRQWLEDVRAGTERGDAQSSLLEALDHVARKLDDAAVAAASAAVAEQNALLASEAVASALADAAAAGSADAAAGAPDALAALQAALPLSAAAQADLSSALPSAADPAADLAAALPPALREKLAALLPRLSSSQLRDLSSALASGDSAAPPGAAGLRDLDRLFSDLPPDALDAVADLLGQVPPDALAAFAEHAASLSDAERKSLSDALSDAAAGDASALPPELLAKLPEGLSPEALAALCKGGSALPPALLKKMAEVMSRVPPETLRKYAEALRRGSGGNGGAPGAELSLRELLALSEMLDELTPEVMAELAELFDKLSRQDFQKMLGGGSSPSAPGAAPRMMTPEEFRQYLDKLRQLAALSSNELARLAQRHPGCCNNPAFAPLPSPQAALDALLASAGSCPGGAAAAASALGLCPGNGGPGGGGSAAPLGFSDPTPPAGPGSFRDAPLVSADGPPDPSSSILLGVSAGDPEAGDAAAPVSSGALDPSSSSPDDAGATRAAPVLPRHRKTIESYFGDEQP